jgi:hypothetical protein
MLPWQPWQKILLMAPYSLGYQFIGNSNANDVAKVVSSKGDSKIYTELSGTSKNTLLIHILVT